MNNRFLPVGMLVAAFLAASARDASAQITSASASGPGGTVSNIVIDKTIVANDSISLDASFTSLAPITFTLTVGGPGEYYIGYPTGSLTDSTGSAFPSFYASLGTVPAGSLLNSAGFDSHVFKDVTFGPTINPTSVTFNGPPGLAAGGTTDIYTAVQVPSSVTGPATVQVIWSPTPLAAVPEPSTLVLGLIGAAAGLGYLARRRRV